MTYRHPYSCAARPNRFTRPPKPPWLQRPRSDYAHSANCLRSYDYWTCMYWATPPWLTDDHIAQMKAKKLHVPEGFHLDHDVPLKSPLVCGLNVPWNLVHLPAKVNLQKSNSYWENMPMQPVDMFDPHKFQPFNLEVTA